MTPNWPTIHVATMQRQLAINEREKSPYTDHLAIPVTGPVVMTAPPAPILFASAPVNPSIVVP